MCGRGAFRLEGTFSQAGLGVGQNGRVKQRIWCTARAVELESTLVAYQI